MWYAQTYTSLELKIALIFKKKSGWVLYLTITGERKYPITFFY